jgi:hypothetical protein
VRKTEGKTKCKKQGRRGKGKKKVRKESRNARGRVAETMRNNGTGRGAEMRKESNEGEKAGKWHLTAGFGVFKGFRAGRRQRGKGDEGRGSKKQFKKGALFGDLFEKIEQKGGFQRNSLFDVRYSGFGIRNSLPLAKYVELNGVFYMENAPLGIKAVEASSNKELWSLDTGQQHTYDPIFDEGEIFIRTISSVPAEIYSIDQSTGKVNWAAFQDALSNLCVVGTKIYFTIPDGYLVAINRYSGTEISKVQFSPKFDMEKQIGSYRIACDKVNNVLAISFGDNTQIMGLKILNP